MNINCRNILAVAPFWLAAVILQAGLLSYFQFGSDEGDNMLGAMSVARGGDIYKAFFSQHMPFAYYFTSLFALMGVKSVLGFRLAFNIVLLLFWLVLYWVYAGRMNKRIFLFVMAAYPLIAPFCLGHLILADVFTAYALVVLLIEYLCYLEDQTLFPGRMVVIALCAFIAVMSCFIGIYAVFIILLGFGIGELKGLSRAVLPGRVRRWLLFLLVLAVPFGLLLGWYAVTGNLWNFYEQAYLFNRAVYSHYVGLGTSAFWPFIYLPLLWLLHVRDAVADSLNRGAVTLNLLLACANIVFLAGLFRRQRLAAIVMLMFLAVTGIRGYTNFHAMPYYGVSLLIFGVVLSWLDRPKLWAWLASLCALLIFLGAAMPEYARLSEFSTAPIRKAALFPDPYDSVIQTCTRESDMIWSAGINAYIYIDNDRIPASRVWGLTPWFAEQYAGVILEDLKTNRPKLIIFNPEQHVWGHRLGNYGSNIFSYIQAHYQILDASDPVKRNVYLLK